MALCRHFFRTSYFTNVKIKPRQHIANFSSISDTNQNETRPNGGIENEANYDIVISGGGMVGFAAGCALGLSERLEDKRILLLEKQPNRSWSLPDEFSNRVCALNLQTQKLFNALGVWDLITSVRAQPVKKMQVSKTYSKIIDLGLLLGGHHLNEIWESCSEALITFCDEDNQWETIAHIVENDVILDALKKKLPSCVKVEYGSNVSSYHLPSSAEEQVTVNLDNGRKITTDLLIGADGFHSGVREAMKSKYLSWEYNQSGIVATLHLSEEQENFVAWQKFIPTGPVAILPLSSTRSSLVWSTTKAHASQLLSLSDEDFVDALNNSIWQDEDSDPLVRSLHEKWQSLLQSISSRSVGAKQLPPSISGIAPKSRASFPLGLGHAAQYVAHRVALIGDAAHRVHPLAGQGVNLGFGDVECLVNTLENAVLQGSDIGDVRELHRFETKRQRHNVATMGAVDALYRLYSTQVAPLVLLRSLGLSAVDALYPLKKRIVAHAEG